MEEFLRLQDKVFGIRSDLIALLRSSGCSLQEEEIDLKLLWVCDLQDLAPAEYHPRICELWHLFWVNLWELRSVCEALGHANWVEKPWFRHPHHRVCERCGSVRVFPPTSTSTSSTSSTSP
jgi:hypothetical protein